MGDERVNPRADGVSQASSVAQARREASSSRTARHARSRSSAAADTQPGVGKCEATAAGFHRPIDVTNGTCAGGGAANNTSAPTVEAATVIAAAVITQTAARGQTRFDMTRLSAATTSDATNGM